MDNRQELISQGRLAEMLVRSPCWLSNMICAGRIPAPTHTKVGLRRRHYTMEEAAQIVAAVMMERAMR